MPAISLSGLARRLLWGSVPVYRLYRRVRFGDDLFRQKAFRFWVGGFPRSSNTYTAHCLSEAAGGEAVAHYLHTPPQIKRALKSGKPGIFVVREPKPAVISWCIHSGHGLRASLDYYIDFHQMLLSMHNDLFVASFEQTTTSIGTVLDRFDQSFKLDLDRVEATDVFVQQRFRNIEAASKTDDGGIDERRVARPSIERRALVSPYEALLDRSQTLQYKLEIAQAVYGRFVRPNRFAMEETTLLQCATAKNRVSR